MSPEDMDWRRLGPKKRGSSERDIYSKLYINPDMQIQFFMKNARSLIVYYV